MSDLSDPTVHAFDPERLAHLRTRASARLKGTQAAHGVSARAADALSVLHALASSPATAADALALLHELQVHQVELELQAQEMLESRATLEAALRRQIELYDCQPVGHFTIDARGVPVEMNQTGGDMLGTARNEAFTLPIDAFLCADSAQRLWSAISSLETGLRRSSCRLTLRPKAGAERQVIASIGKDPAANRYLLSLTDVAGEAQQPPPSP